MAEYIKNSIDITVTKKYENELTCIEKENDNKILEKGW